MGYERYPRDDDRQDYGRNDGASRDYGSNRDYGSAGGGARDTRSAGQYGDNDRDRQGYGGRDYGNQRHAQRDAFQAGRGGRDYYGGPGGSYDRDAGRDSGREMGRGYAGQSGGYSERSRYGADADRDTSNEYHGSYGAGSRRFEDFGRTAHADDDNYRDPDRGYRTTQQGGYGRPQQHGYGRTQQQGYGRQPQGYDYEDRGFFARAGDEVRSWFGDEDAERRREYDSRMDERYDTERDNDYHSWRRTQIQSLDRDYDEYRRENRTKFDNEFGSWRSNRQTQRASLDKVEEHMDVVGSDGEHVGTVDKVRGDRILLTKNDAEAGGRHHSIPSSWLQTVDGKVTLSKTGAEAKKAWRDEERNQAMFGDDNADRGSAMNRLQGTSYASGTAATSTTTASGQSTAGQSTAGTDAGTDGGKTLNRSFSGTY